VIAPDGHALDVVDVRAGLRRQLRQSAIVIQARHGGEITPRIEAGRVAAGDQRVGIGGVAHHQHAQRTVRDRVQRLALRGKDLRVGQQQILAFHARPARPRAHQQRDVAVAERDPASSLA
jgi:hypothetical protein